MIRRHFHREARWVLYESVLWSVGGRRAKCWPVIAPGRMGTVMGWPQREKLAGCRPGASGYSQLVAISRNDPCQPLLPRASANTSAPSPLDIVDAHRTSSPNGLLVMLSSRFLITGSSFPKPFGQAGLTHHAICP